MNDNDKKVQNQGDQHSQGGPCWGPAPWAACRPDISSTDSGRYSGAEMPHAMAGCFSGCRYFLLFAAIVGIIFLILGYYLVPEVIGTWWMIPAAMMAVMMAAMALFAVLAMRRTAMSNGFSRCCGASPRRHA